MSLVSTDQTVDAGFRCPTCRARQVPSETCRRCQCDLSLLLRIDQQCARLRAKCLVSLRDGRTDEALATAAVLRRLRADEDSARLFTVACLHQENWREALSAYRLVSEDSTTHQ